MGDKEHHVTKDPWKTDGDENGDVHTELLLAVTLVWFWSSSQGLVNFTTDEEEENSIGRNDDQAGQEKAKKSKKSWRNVAHFSHISVGQRGSSSNTHKSREHPGEQMIPFLKELGLTITPNDHLIKVEGDTEGPAEISQEEVMDGNRSWNTRPCVIDPRLKWDQEGCEANNDAYAEVQNELDGVGTNIAEDQKSD